MLSRGCGILLHITSLPSAYGIGDLGPGAYRFVDFLSAASQKYWQILPLTPTNIFLGNSPYSSFSAFAGNPFLISPDLLLREGLLNKKDLSVTRPRRSDSKVFYKDVIRYKTALLRKAFRNFQSPDFPKKKFESFVKRHEGWLEEYSLFVALKGYFRNKKWHLWPKGLKERRPEVLREYRQKLRKSILRQKFYQYVFFSQWHDLKKYAHQKKIRIIGDIPIYVNYDSVDVWIHPEIFDLDEKFRPNFVAGVPPDYFSKKGQLWGNPVYRWSVLQKTGFDWWKRRFRHNFELYDIVRLDHFRGFVAFWRVAHRAKNAVRGRWIRVPVYKFFREMKKTFRPFPVIAEDLGIITPRIRKAMKEFGFPGMKLLLFGFDGNFKKNTNAPHQFRKNHVVYTGTHDNNTVKGWFQNEAGKIQKENLATYLGRPPSAKNIHIDFIRIGLASKADVVIFPLQDVLGLGQESRMNIPSTKRKNWIWRVPPGRFSPAVSSRLKALVRDSRRA